MTKLLPALTLAAVLALLPACATIPADDGLGGVPSGSAYLALGTEPFWSVEITDARIAYNDAENRSVRVANPGARPSFNGRRYVSPRMTVDITATPCSDGMSDRRYADTVLVAVDGRELRGCGGRVLPPEQLDGTAWRIVSIDGSEPVAGRDMGFRFEGGRISGSAGCNRLSGSFASDGTRLTVGQVAATRMACAPELMAQEARVQALLRQSLGVSFDGQGRMVLSGAGGATMVLERSL